MLSGRFVEEGAITTNIVHLSLGRLANVEFPLPPFTEQIRIVIEVERPLSLVRSVEIEVNNNLKRSQALPQTILAKSFAGQSWSYFSNISQFVQLLSLSIISGQIE